MLKHQGLYNGLTAEEPFPTAIYQQPVTEQRKPFKPAAHDTLRDAGTARANIAADTRCPNGTVEGDFAEKHKHQTVVQQHCDYFDTDHDGILWPYDTYIGCRKWGEFNQHLYLMSALELTRSCQDGTSS